MRLLLKKNLKKLGQIGDIVDVKDGYGRNFLLPCGHAVSVTPENLRFVNLEKEKALALEALQREETDEIVSRLDGASVNISVKASEDGHLYGSVNAQLVAEKLAEAGIAVDEKNIRMTPLKELGEYTVQVHVRDDLVEDLKVLVVAEVGDDATESSSEASEG